MSRNQVQPFKLNNMGVVGSALQAGMSIAAVNKTNRANKEIAQMNNAFNEKMLQKQMTYNTEMYQRQLGDTWQFYNDSKQNQWDMWNATNEYNSASAQRQRLEAAGLNPQLLMSGNNVGTATATGGTSASSPSAQGINPPTATPYSADYSGYAGAIANAISLYNDVANSRAARSEINERAQGLNIDNKTKYAEAIARVGNIMADTEDKKSKALLNSITSSFYGDYVRSQIDKNNADTVKIKQETQGQILQNMQMNEQLKRLPEMLQLEISQKTADVALRISQRSLTENQAKRELKEIALLLERTVVTQKEKEYLSRTLDDRVNQAYYEAKHAFYNYGPDGQMGLGNLGFTVLDRLLGVRYGN